MKCPYCGTDNRDDAASCDICEMPLNSPAPRRTPAKPNAVRPAYVEEPSYGACPNCAAPLHDCTPVSKTSVTNSGGGYGFFSGCCGLVLLGPLGLLCGLKKQTITSSSQTWWVCRRCGKEFLEKDAAKEVADAAISGAAAQTFVITLVWYGLFYLMGYNSWVRDISLLAIVGIWLAIPEGIKTSTGYIFKELLSPEERKEFYKKCAFYGILSFVIGLILCDKVMEFLLG